MCYGRAKEILERNRNLMDAVVDILVEKKSLQKEEFFNLVKLHGSLQPMPPSVVDLRSAKRLEFQDTLTNQKEVVSQGRN
nr:PREDICTED: probable inactive ATP-dependent zinc metalloprotease FTSHI 2, chloroplastic [Nicotiana tabacum]